MSVLKRDGRQEVVQIDKVAARLRTLCCQEPALSHEVDVALITQKVAQGIFDGVKTTDIDNLAAETAAYMSTTHLAYGDLAARLVISNLHKETSDSFAEVMEAEFRNVSPSNSDMPAPLIATETWEITSKHKVQLEQAIDCRRDYCYDYFGFKTLQRSYLVRIGDRVVERPQYMFMRVAIGIHGDDIENIIKTYDYLSQGWFIHATPTLFNSGTENPQMSSCFLLSMKEDSIAGIYDTLKQTALISKSAGGVGLAIHNVRAARSYIKGTNGTSNGLVPMLRVFNDTARYVDQGGGKRKGAFAIYVEPWHADIGDFLHLKRNHGNEERRARDLFYALWIPDLFMKRVQEDGEWSLFCPAEAPGLSDCWGEAFENLYTHYERERRYRERIRARDLWHTICQSQIETGTPYVLYKDACNSKSNQQNLGTIKCSNLCSEIVEYVSCDEVAVCNLASLALPKYVTVNREFDHQKLFEVVYHVTGNLNKIIDRGSYPLQEAKRSNRRHRPIGIGVQGLADVFLEMRLPFESREAAELNKAIFETIYFAALTRSKDLAKLDGPYDSFHSSPASQGTLQFDLWKVDPSFRWDWAALKTEIRTYGLRNSLTTAAMPTASTSQILGNNECFEPYTSNIYTRRVLAGEFYVVNKHLIGDLMALGLWCEDIKNQIIADGGSVQNIPEIPCDIKDLYKTVWEIKQRCLIDMAADRGAFIDQSQSLNVFIAQPSYASLTSMHFYAWNKGLKTGMYYLRTRPAAEAIKFTVDRQGVTIRADAVPDPNVVKDDDLCSMEGGCLRCGS